ncbi:hypothetical protein EV14_2794 [Prochlorococcus sp. MIT 0703]|nr:hypothetical protein EV12_2691 [Prochlorococcus sp. MIT 0701]KGG30855.1 hypothetical protein EV14_2794 [Prochlorococcus sp. MIT 0703]
MPFGPEKSGTANKSLPQMGSKSPKIKKAKATSSSQQAIPKPVANRMLRRVIFASGLPTAAGMGVFVASYLIVSRGIADISPLITLISSGACFLFGLIGLSYGVLSASWEDAPGSLLGLEHIRRNIGRMRDSIKANQPASKSEIKPKESGQTSDK